MSESKLRTQSMDFAVSIINLVKYLKENASLSSPTKSAEAAPLSVQISVKHNMPTEKLTLFRNCKLH